MALFLMFCLLAVLFTSGVQSNDNCGTRKTLEPALTHHGNKPIPGEWPWHAAIFHRMNQTDPSYACGGSIIASKYILTTASCTYSPSEKRPLKVSEILVRGGVTNLQKLDRSLQENSVAEIVRHELYLARSTSNNIALLKLTKELEITDYVSPICLWGKSESDPIIWEEEGYAAGWGLDEHRQPANELKHAKMSIVSHIGCLKSDRSFFGKNMDEGTFCAGFTNGTSIGMGSSGGGLYIKVDGQWKLRGIISLGKLKANGELDTSGYIIFTDVGHYLGWIERTLELQGLASEQLSLGRYSHPTDMEQPQL